MAKKGLGRGLGAIFGEETVAAAAETRQIKNTAARKRSAETTSSGDADVSRETFKIKLSLIEPNAEQPRKAFDDESLNELAASIKEHGVIQPIIVKKTGKTYKIIVGERRWRAARIAGLKEIPAIVRDLDDRETAEIALLDNGVLNEVSYTVTGEGAQAVCTLTIDGLDVAFMLTPETEAPAEMINYFPAYRALWMAELCNGTLHNLYPIRGAQVRDSAAWSRYLTDALVRWGDGTDVVFQSHNWPHRNAPGHPEGNDFVRNTAAAYRWIHDQTLLLANQGLTPQEIARRVELPPELARCGYLRPYYGTVEVNCRAVYQKYLGFYDGNPVHLNPLPDTESAKRYVDYMGGADEILRRAEEDFAAGDYQWVAEVTQRVVFADPACRRARQLCADAMEQLGYQAESGIWRNAYLAAAEELRFGTREAHLKRGNGQILQSLSPDFLLDYLGIVLDGERAQALSLRLNLLVTDGGETYRYLLELRCGTLLVYHGGRDDAARTLTVTKDVLAALVHKQLDTVQGQIPDADMELLRGIETYVTDLDHQPPFHVVEP